MILIRNTILRKCIGGLLLFFLLLSPIIPTVNALEEDFPSPETFVEATTTETVGAGNHTVSDESTPTHTTPEELVLDGAAGSDTGSGTSAEAAATESQSDSDTATSGATGAHGSAAGSPGVRGRAVNVYIRTGDASAYASIINYLNTTVIGSADFDVINIYGPTAGVLDFSDFNLSGSASASGTEGDAADPSLDADISNEESVSTDLRLDASSGSNRIEGFNGSVIIETGDVQVDASVFNMVNTNLVGHNWKFKIINIFSDLVGDLILPTLYSEKTSAGCSGCLSSVQVTADNTASVTNEIDIRADTGNNTASGNGGSVIETGDVRTDAAIVNLVDTTIVGDNWNFTKFHVSGDWQGSIYNANSTADFLMSDHDVTVRDENGSGDSADASGQLRQFAEKGAAAVANSANVNNSLTINANTGRNNAANGLGDAVVRTGDITANASITNVVNTTLIGNGWRFYLVNIFGNWKGSAHYGMPDLAVSEVAVPEAAPARRGNTITYVYSYTNGGDTIARDVIVRDRFDADKVHVTDTSGGVVRGNTITWRVGSLKPRETRVISYVTTVNAPDGSLPVQNEVSIAASNSDRDLSNNTTSGTVAIAALANSSPSHSSGGSATVGSHYFSAANPEYHLTKTSDHESYRVGETIPFTIILENFKPGSGHAVGVVDQFFGPSGDVLMTKAWELGEVVGFEHIEISYEVPIPATAIPGPYVNTVSVFSKNARGEIQPTIVANLPVTIAEAQRRESGASFEMPTAFLDDALLHPSDATGTPTSTSVALSFAVQQPMITRSLNPAMPQVFGYSLVPEAAAQTQFAQAPNASGRTAQYQFLAGLWLILMLIGALLLYAYRYLKSVMGRHRRSAYQASAVRRMSSRRSQ